MSHSILAAAGPSGTVDPDGAVVSDEPTVVSVASLVGGVVLPVLACDAWSDLTPDDDEQPARMSAVTTRDSTRSFIALR